MAGYGDATKARLFLVAMLLLTGCDQKQIAAAPDNAASNAVSPIVNQPEAAPVDNAAPSEALAPPRAAPSRPASNVAHYRALGTEPFWAVTIKGSVATLERPDKAPVSLSITRTDDGRALRYLADGFAMTVTEGPCSDGMSDARWSDNVALAYSEGTLKGCGGAREDF